MDVDSIFAWEKGIFCPKTAKKLYGDAHKPKMQFVSLSSRGLPKTAVIVMMLAFFFNSLTCTPVQSNTNNTVIIKQ